MQIAQTEISVWDPDSIFNKDRPINHIGRCRRGDIFIELHSNLDWSFCLTRFGYVACLTRHLSRKR